MRQWTLAPLALLALGALAEEKKDFSNGFGEELNWVSWENARELAKMQRKPVMLLIHKSWCGACQALKAKFTTKSSMEQLKQFAKHFVMVNTEDDEEPWEEEFQPDGKYIPRIFFITPDGDVMDQKNDKAELKQYKYYYENTAQVMLSMRAVMKTLGIKDDAPAIVGAGTDDDSSGGSPPAAKPPGEPAEPAAKPPAPKKADEYRTEL